MTQPSSQLGPDWTLGPDGMFWRAAARVLLVDDRDRLLLVRGHDVDNPARSWWFTLGGGIDPGESAPAAAVREVAEETGLQIGTGDLIGPVLRRSAIFDFQRQHVRQEEQFYLARIDRPAPVHQEGWTDVERSFMDEVRWWDLAELAQVRVEVFPEGLAELTGELLRGWDGKVRDLGLGWDRSEGEQDPAGAED